MPIEAFMISVFVGVDDTRKALLGSPKPGRTRGPAPRWEDSEVRTMEWGGEFRGRPGSTSFRTWPESIGLGGCDRRPAWCGSRSDWGGFWGLGSLPTARSRSSTVFPSMSVSRPEPIESASFGMRRPGVKPPFLVSGGICVSKRGFGVGGMGDRRDGSPQRRKAFSQQGLALLAPPKRREQDASCGWTSWLTQTVIRQRTERFHAKRTWARDLLHLALRIFRKVLRPTLAVFLNRREGREPLQLSLLVTS